MKLCAVAAQPGHKGTAVRQPRVCHSLAPYPGPRTACMLLRKPEAVDGPISVGRCTPLPPLHDRDLGLGLSLVQEILARTEAERLMKIYNHPTFSSMLGLLTMLALSTGRLLKVSPVYIYILIPSLLPDLSPLFLTRRHPRYPLRSATSARRLKPSRDPFLLPTTRVTYRAYAVHDPRKCWASCSGRRDDRPRTDPEYAGGMVR